MAQSVNPIAENPSLSESGEEAASNQSLEFLTVDDNLFVPLLPKLAATPVHISRQYMLKISIAGLRLTTSQTVHYDNDDNSFFATVQIHVPTHENIPQFKTTIFAGNNCQTMDAALESASLHALIYMQKANIVIIDDLNLPELAKCQKQVVRAKSWSDIFEHETVKLKKRVGSLERELACLKQSCGLHTPVQQAHSTEELGLQNDPPQFLMMPPSEGYAEGSSSQQAMPLQSLFPSQSNSPSTPPTEQNIAKLILIANETKENNKGKDPLLSATTSNKIFPSRVPPKTATLGARRTLFTSRKQDMDT